MTASDAIAREALETFAWKPQTRAGRWIDAWIDRVLADCPEAATLAQRLRAETGTRLRDWIDTIDVPDTEATRTLAGEAGFAPDPLLPSQASAVWHHPGGLFPRLRFQPGMSDGLMLKVESVADFLAAHPQWTPLVREGEPLAPLSLACLARRPAATLWVVERHGTRSYQPPPWSAEQTRRVQRHALILRQRRRDWPPGEEAAGLAHLQELVDAAVADLGAPRACDVFFTVEREYWQQRNDAARVQKARQDRLGMGWANHDHHTYRSSRTMFPALVRLFESLGLVCRERFYAGRQAGWGAQVMEQPVAGIVVFADVDLEAEAVRTDFAHHPLSPTDALGTVGLWCGLHGESILQAGMHHLECQFDFDALAGQLHQEAGIRVMAPFTDLPYLRQAFTEGQRWPVAEARLAYLRARGWITDEQAERFRREGAIGSHLENLERHDGYKGFNQQGISQIIAATDPRKHLL